jgi:hypothetical protein
MKKIIISSVIPDKVNELVKLTSVDDGFRYADIANCTYTEISKKLDGVDSIILRRPDDAIYLHAAKWGVDLKRIDVAFLKRISKESPAIDSLVRRFHDISFVDISLPRSKYNRSDTIERILIKLETDSAKLMITKKQLLLLKSIYMITCSDKTVVVKDTIKHIIYGSRKQLCAVRHLVGIATDNRIRVGVIDDDGVRQISSYSELEECASTFPMDTMVDVYPSNRIIGNTYHVSVIDTKRIHTTITKLLRTGCHDDTKFVFMKTVPAFKGVESHVRNKHTLDPTNVTYYGASGDARHHDTVVLLGVPRLNPYTAFITDPDPEMSVKRYRRFHILRAIGRARVVYCVGISTQYLEDVLSGIPRIWYHDEHHNDPSKK